MRVIARNSLMRLWVRHPETKTALEYWFRLTRAADWASMQDVQQTFPKAKVLNGDRVRFEIHGGDYRLIVAFRFDLAITFVKFVGSHADYDRIDALTASLF